MDPITLMLLSSGVQAGGSLLGGLGAKAGADLNAFSLETEKRMSEAEAIQRNNDRMETFRSNLSANIAAFASQGRDVGADRSVSAFLDKQREIAVSDTARSDFMAMMQGMQLSQKAAATRQEGRASLVAGVTDAFTTMVGAKQRYDRVKMPKG